MGKRLLLLAAGIVCYLVGMLLFIVVALDAFTAPPETSFKGLSNDQLPLLAVGLLLVVLGSYINYRSGVDIRRGRIGPGRSDGRGRAESVLADHGYRVPPDESDEPPTADPDRVRCSECGTENERGYSYCSTCSAELPG